jgi:hypothetical protein
MLKEKKKEILIVGKAEDFFKQRLHDFLLDRKEITAELFICSDYIASILASFLRESPRKILAAEYFGAYSAYKRAESDDNPLRPEYFLERGGQACFVTCVFFPVFRRRSLVDEKYYAEMGTMFFYRFYREADSVVAGYMAERFDELVPLTREAVQGKKDIVD